MSCSLLFVDACHTVAICFCMLCILLFVAACRTVCYLLPHAVQSELGKLLYESNILHITSCFYKEVICDCPCKTKPSSHKIEIHFLAQLIATHISYLHSMSPMARLNWSAFLGGGFTAL